jgi:peptidoglycan hydrolase-like protein with peptidoglycan-binding domain
MAEVSDPQRDFYSRALTAYRGGTLKKGASGKTVRALQLFLRDKGYDIAADGKFGKNTEAALRKWQKAEGLSSDGQAGQRQTFKRVRETVTPRPRQRPATAPPPVQQVPRSRVVPTGPPNLEGVPPGVGANEAAFSAAQQVAPGGGLSDATEAMMTAAPGIGAESYPVGAGGGRPNPAGRPVERTLPFGPFPARPGEPGALPAAPVAPEVASQDPYADPSRQFDEPPPMTRMAEALAGTGPPAPSTVQTGMPTLSPETAPEIAGLPPLNDISPQDMNLIMALLQRAQQQPPPGAGY